MLDAVEGALPRHGLVRTGVDKEGDETNSAAVVVDGVREAVDWILAQEAAADAVLSDGGRVQGRSLVQPLTHPVARQFRL